MLMKLSSSRKKALFLTNLFFIIIMILLFYFFTSFQGSLLKKESLHNAKIYAHTIETLRHQYSTTVIQKIQNQKEIMVTHNHKENPHTIPLPITFTIELSEKIKSSFPQKEIRLYSPYPFPWRKNIGGLRDSFAIRAWEKLQRNPQTPYFEFTNQSPPILRYATTDIMVQSCVNCHNSHKDTPKNDWRVGDVRGILEISSPIINTPVFSLISFPLFILLLSLLLGIMFVIYHTLYKFFTKQDKLRKVLLNNEQTIATMKLEADKTTDRNQSVIETAVDGIATIDTKGIIQTVNPSFLKLFQYDRSEIIGENIRIIMPEPYNIEHDEYLRRYGETGEKRIIGIGREVIGKRKDYTVFPAHLSVSEFYIEGELMYTGIIRDLTKEKHTEKELLQARELAHVTTEELQHSHEILLQSQKKTEELQYQLMESNKMASLGAMSSGIAHELNQPLGAILLKAEMLPKLAENLNKPKIQKISKDIKEQLLRAKKIMDSLRIFSRDGKAADREKTTLNTIINDVTTLFTDEFKLLGINFTLQLTEKDTTVFVSPVQIGQIISNLLTNSRDAIAQQENPQITIKTDVIKNVRYLQVIDNGEGIPDNVINKIFEPFYTTKSIGKGTGLGLSLSYSMTKDNGGTITVQSPKNKGTTFTLQFPNYVE